jgi:hypothetical protein
MSPTQQRRVFDFRVVHEASARLLGYFVHTCYSHYLRVIEDNLQRLHEHGVIGGGASPPRLRIPTSNSLAVLSP